MQTGAWERWGAIAGILFAVLFVAGVILLSAATPPNDRTDQQIIVFFQDDAHNAAGIAGVYCLALAGLAMLAFLTTLRRAIEGAQASTSGAGQLAFVCGVIFVAMTYAYGSLAGAVPASLAFGTIDEANPGVARFLPQAGYGALLVFGMFAAGGLILSTSLYSMRTGFLPRWHAWFGLFATLALVFAAVFFPAIVLPLWVIVTSILLLRRPPSDLALVTASITEALFIDAADVIEPDDDASEADVDPTQSKTTH